MSTHPGYPSHPGHHQLLPCPTHDEGARQTFVRDLRAHLAVETGFAKDNVKRIQQPSHASAEQTGDGYVNFFTWPILTATA